MKLSLSTGLAAGLLAIFAAPALAAPVTVDLRIEGATRTLFEGPVTTDVRQFPSNQGLKTCDGTPQSQQPAVTRGAVIAAAAEAAPFSFSADWNDEFGSATFRTVAGENVDYDPATQRFLAEYRNGVSAGEGACTGVVGNGDRVLFAYSAFGDVPLALSGPATAKPGEAVTLKVTHAASGDPVPGAVVEGATSGADGTVTVGPWSEPGNHDLKASRAAAIRSNRVRVCVTDGADGACGSSRPVTPGAPAPGSGAAVPDRIAPRATLAGLRDKQILSRGPRELRGSFADSSGIKVVKLRLTKRIGKKCWYFSGRMERFRGTRCGRGPYFAIGDRADWSYLLPARLEPGRYVLDAVAVDGAGNRTPLSRGTTWVVFSVR